MGTYGGRRAGWWFGKRTKLPAQTVTGSDAQGREGVVSQSGRWFSLDWWYGSANGPGHYQERTGDGKFGDAGHAQRRREFGGRSQLGQRGETPAARQRRAKADYAAYCHERFLAAEGATNGYMTTKAADVRGIKGNDFFDPDARRRPSMKWASDELRAWFGDGSAAAGEKGHRGAGKLLSFTSWQGQTREKAAA